MPGAHRPARGRRPERREPLGVRRGEIDLPQDDRHLGHLPPPLGRVAAGERRVRDGEQRPRAEVRQRGEEREHVRPVLRVRVRPRRRRLRAEELVLRHDRGLAAGDADGVVVEALRPCLHQRRIGGLGGRADAVLEVEVVENGGRALLTHAPRRSVPDATASTSPGLATMGASWPAKSTQTGPLSGMPHASASAAGAPASAASTTRRRDHFTTRRPG